MTAGPRVDASLNVWDGQEWVGELRWTFDGWVGIHGGLELETPLCKTDAQAARKLYRLWRADQAPSVPKPVQPRKVLRSAPPRAPTPREELISRIEAEAKRIVRACRKDLGHLTRDRLRLVVRVSARPKRYTGRAHGYDKVTLTVGHEVDWWRIQWLLTHELAHLVHGTDPKGSGRKRIVHGPRWQEAFCRIAERAHGVDCWSECSEIVIWSSSRGVDRALRDALRSREAS